MFTMEVTVTAFAWPRLNLTVKLPGNRVISSQAYYDIALTKFEADVRNGLQLMINDVLSQNDPKHKRSQV